MSSLAEENLRAARVKLQHDKPYLSTAIWALRLVESKDCLCPVSKQPTMGVSKAWTCWFHPEIAHWPVSTLATVLTHEIWHLLREHFKRAEVQGVTLLNAVAWNWATDAEINDGLVAAGAPFPPGLIPIVPAILGMPDNLLAEEYYSRMPRQEVDVCQFGGSCADGLPREYETDCGGKDKDGESGKQQKQRVVPAELIRKQVAEEIGRYAGKMPGSWQRWAGKLLMPKYIPWQTILRAVIGRTLAAGKRDEYTFARQSRRECLGYIFPGQIGTIPEMVCCLDVSGSMYDELIGEGLHLIDGILEFLGRLAPLTVIVGDTVPQTTQRVLSSANIKLQGGGGTDMGALIAHALTLRPRPQVIVVITDGYTPWPEKAPVGVQTVVVLVANGESPGWARTVRVRPTEEK